MLAKLFKTNVLTGLAILLFAASTAQAQNCTVNAGVPQTVCASEQLTLFGGFTGISGGAFYWQQISGPTVIIDEPDSLTTTVSGITGGTSLGFRFYGLCGDGSIVWDEVTHTILPITIANAGPDQSSCPGTDVITMAANLPAATETQVWSFSGGNMGITIDNIADPNAKLSLSETNYGTAVMIWTISSASCSTSDTVLITNCGGEATVSSNRTGNDTVWLGSCYNTTTSYRANASYPGFSECGQQGVWNLLGGPNFPDVNNLNDRRARFSNLVPGTYTFQWCVSGPCVSGCDSLTLIVPDPVGAVTNASASGGVYCEGITEAIINGTPPTYTGEVVTWTQTAGPACTIESPNSPTTVVSGLDGSSNYDFTYTISNPLSGCTSDATAR